MIVGYMSPTLKKIPVDFPNQAFLFLKTVHPFLSLMPHFVLSFLLPSIYICFIYAYFEIDTIQQEKGRPGNEARKCVCTTKPTLF